jgi:hypothetical protein
MNIWWPTHLTSIGKKHYSNAHEMYNPDTRVDTDQNVLGSFTLQWGNTSGFYAASISVLGSLRCHHVA